MNIPGAFANNNKYNLKEWKIGCNLKRNKGEKWIFKGQIRIWSGKIWHCQHNKRKEHCTTCGGGSICEHKKRRSRCKECGGGGGGGSICEHKKQRSSCIQCGGGSICEHKKRRSRCIQCGGGSICEHKKQRSRCKECGGGSICEHKRERSSCKECGGGSICEHNRIRSSCIQCEGSQICRICKSKHGNRKYDKLCVTCAIQEGYTVKRNYKTKELSMVEFITQHTDVDWVNDKAYDLGCSKKRPDLVSDLGSHILIIECDENKHKNGNYICENKRIMELSQDFSENNIHRPIVIIRFNPDSYVDSNNQKIESCWKAGKDDILRINNKENWDLRLNELLEITHHYIANQPIKDVTFEYLFYDNSANII
tara:strand:- start:4632 stop:5732 length:1101 start_codon:yes stop_codon:yes gene_type:complete